VFARLSAKSGMDAYAMKSMTNTYPDDFTLVVKSQCLMFDLLIIEITIRKYALDHVMQMRACFGHIGWPLSSRKRHSATTLRSCFWSADSRFLTERAFVMHPNLILTELAPSSYKKDGNRSVDGAYSIQNSRCIQRYEVHASTLHDIRLDSSQSSTTGIIPHPLII